MDLRLDRIIKPVILILLLAMPLLLEGVEYRYHRVRRGDTLYSLGRRYGVSVEQIKRLNNLSSDNLSINQRLKISEIKQSPRPITPQPTQTQQTTTNPVQTQQVQSQPANTNLPDDYYHTVAQGEGLYRIAVNNSITLNELLRFNGFENANIPIKPGDRIIIKDPTGVNPIPQTASEATQQLTGVNQNNQPAISTNPVNINAPASNDTVVVEKVYVVQRGDTLYRIATNNGISVDELKRRNNLTSNEISVGQRLYIVGTPPPRSSITAPQIQETESERLRSDLHMPVIGRVTSNYGIRNGRPHKGIDISARTGTPIYAVLDGTVVYSGVQGGYGNVVVLEHSGFVMTIYAHNERNLVNVGDVVQKGQQIATVGSSGDTTGPHLHFEYRIKGKPINPTRVLNFD